ncbi:MAG: hypothetical protein ACLPVY_27140 [Acidimicrobiia bacterium]
MGPPQKNCQNALKVLVGDAEQQPRDEVLRARFHARRCPRCASAYAPVEPGDPVLRTVARCEPAPAAALRIGLALIGVTQLVVAIPWLVGKSFIPDSHVAVSQLTRDGALGYVVAALGLVTAWRPRYAHSMMIMGLFVCAVQVIAGLADTRTGSVSAPFEAVHVLLPMIVLGICGIAADTARRATPSREPTRPHAIHALH